MEIEPLEMEEDELVWLQMSGMPSERRIAGEELRRRVEEANTPNERVMN